MKCVALLLGAKNITQKHKTNSDMSQNKQIKISGVPLTWITAHKLYRFSGCSFIF